MKEKNRTQLPATTGPQTWQFSPSWQIFQKSLIGRDLFKHLRLAATQSNSSQGIHVNNISSLSEFKEYIAKKLSLSDLAYSKIKNYVAKSIFHKDFQPRHQKIDAYLLIFKIRSKMNSKSYYPKNT